MAIVTVTTDADRKGFEVDVQPLEGGGWETVEPGFHGFGAGQLTKVYVDGQVHWVQRSFSNLRLLPD
ncbi:hypothetical protein [Actinoplanes sp. NPDC051851]|uniref:hypothetical protein n=1 Tax=Actinoplanes sp. NPDC051851 TaxID=3154753 RepID=UPI0034283C5F